MPVVAIARGTSSVSRSVVKETVTDGEFEVLVLSQKGDGELETALSARTPVVDYSGIDSIATLHEYTRVGTVVSALEGRITPERDKGVIKPSRNPKRLNNISRAFRA